MRVVETILAALFCGLLVSCRTDRVTDSEDHLVLTEVSCADCDIKLDTILTLSDTASDALEFGVTPVLDSRGRAIIPGTNGTVLMEFDSSGTQLTRFGRQGRGPGELSQVYRLVVFPGDTLGAMDSRGVMLLFDAEHRFVREVNLAEDNVYSVLVMDDHSLVATHHARRIMVVPPGQAAPRRIRASSLQVPDSLQRRCVSCGGLMIGSSTAPGTFWVALFTEYRLVLLDTAGTQLRVVDRHTPWMPRRTVDPDFTDPRPAPNVVGVHESPDSILWVISRVPADTVAATVDAGRRNTLEYHFRQNAAMVEAIDLRQGTLVASKRFDGLLTFTPDGSVAMMGLDGADPRISVGRLSLVRKQALPRQRRAP